MLSFGVLYLSGARTERAHARKRASEQASKQASKRDASDRKVRGGLGIVRACALCAPLQGKRKNTSAHTHALFQAVVPRAVRRVPLWVPRRGLLRRAALLQAKLARGLRLRCVVATATAVRGAGLLCSVDTLLQPQLQLVVVVVVAAGPRDVHGRGLLGPGRALLPRANDARQQREPDDNNRDVVAVIALNIKTQIAPTRVRNQLLCGVNFPRSVLCVGWSGHLAPRKRQVHHVFQFTPSAPA